MSLKEDKEFEALLSDAKHEELTNALKDISVSLAEGDENIVNAIKEQGSTVEGLVEAIKNLPEPEAPIVEVNQEEVISSIQQICTDIIASNNKVIEALENRMMPESFTLVKNFGITESVKVQYKPANQLNS